MKDEQIERLLEENLPPKIGGRHLNITTDPYKNRVVISQTKHFGFSQREIGGIKTINGVVQLESWQPEMNPVMKTLEDIFKEKGYKTRLYEAI